MSFEIDHFIWASWFIFRVSSLLVSTTINTNLLCCNSEISRQECNWRHPSGFLPSFTCLCMWISPLVPEVFRASHKPLLLQNRFDLSLFNEQADIKNVVLYCSLFSPCRQSNIDGLLREFVQSPSLLVFEVWLSTAPSNLIWPQGWPSFKQEVWLEPSCGPFSPGLSYKPLLSKFPWVPAGGGNGSSSLVWDRRAIPFLP